MLEISPVAYERTRLNFIWDAARRRKNKALLEIREAEQQIRFAQDRLALLDDGQLEIEIDA